MIGSILEGFVYTAVLIAIVAVLAALIGLWIYPVAMKAIVEDDEEEDTLED